MVLILKFHKLNAPTVSLTWNFMVLILKFPKPNAPTVSSTWNFFLVVIIDVFFQNPHGSYRDLGWKADCLKPKRITRY